MVGDVGNILKDTKTELGERVMFAQKHSLMTSFFFRLWTKVSNLSYMIAR